MPDSNVVSLEVEYALEYTKAVSGRDERDEIRQLLDAKSEVKAIPEAQKEWEKILKSAAKHGWHALDPRLLKQTPVPMRWPRLETKAVY